MKQNNVYIETPNKPHFQNPCSDKDLNMRNIGEIKRIRMYNNIIKTCLDIFWILLACSWIINRTIVIVERTAPKIENTNNTLVIISFFILAFISFLLTFIIAPDPLLKKVYRYFNQIYEKYSNFHKRDKCVILCQQVAPEI
jgi:hypothetical protein